MKLSLTQVIAVILGAMVLLLWASVASADLAAGRAAYIKGDYALALQVYKPLAEQGDPEAQYMLGNLYKSGQGAPHDPREVMKWYKRASDQGHRHAQTAMQNYAYMYPGLYIKINEIYEIYEIYEINETIESNESRARRQAREITRLR